MDGSFSSNLQEETRKVEVESTYLQMKVSKDFWYNSISWNLAEKKSLICTKCSQTFYYISKGKI